MSLKQFGILFVIIFIITELILGGIIMIDQAIFTIFVSGITALIIWWFGFRKLPDRIEEKIRVEIINTNNEIEKTTNKVMAQTDNNSFLSDEHKQIQKHVDYIKLDIDLKKGLDKRTDYVISSLCGAINKLEEFDKNQTELIIEKTELLNKNKELKEKLEFEQKKNKELSKEILNFSQKGKNIEQEKDMN